MADIYSSVKLPSFGPTTGLHFATAERHTTGLLRKTSSFLPSVAQWKKNVVSSARTKDNGTEYGIPLSDMLIVTNGALSKTPKAHSALICLLSFLILLILDLINNTIFGQNTRHKKNQCISTKGALSEQKSHNTQIFRPLFHVIIKLDKLLRETGWTVSVEIKIITHLQCGAINLVAFNYFVFTLPFAFTERTDSGATYGIRVQRDRMFIINMCLSNNRCIVLSHHLSKREILVKQRHTKVFEILCIGGVIHNIHIVKVVSADSYRLFDIHFCLFHNLQHQKATALVRILS